MEKRRIGPGKSFRKGLSWRKSMRMFPGGATAEAWFAEQRWDGKPTCLHCGCDNVQVGAKHLTMPHRCRNRKCRKFFSVRIGTAMQDTKLGYKVWAMAIYILETGIKGTSSMKLHRDLDITQQSAWHLAYRIREAWDTKLAPFMGPDEVDETKAGGKEKNKHYDKKLNAGRGTVGKTTVGGTKDRETKQVQAKVIADTTAKTLTGFVHSISRQEAQTYTDDAIAYQALQWVAHETVNHSVGGYVNGMAHTNGIESFWALPKRGYYGTYYKMSPKHLQRYVNEFVGRHNACHLDTEEQMGQTAKGLVGKDITYDRLTGKLDATAT